MYNINEMFFTWNVIIAISVLILICDYKENYKSLKSFSERNVQDN